MLRTCGKHIYPSFHLIWLFQNTKCDSLLLVITNKSTLILFKNPPFYGSNLTKSK